MPRVKVDLKRAAFAGVVLGLLATAAAGAPRQEEVPEYKVKAAFLVNFVRYAEWPAKAFADPADPFVVAVLGTDPFGEHLDSAFKGRKAGDRGIRIVRAKRMEDMGPVHLLFVAASERDRLKKVLEAVKGRATLVVGDAEGFAKQGVAINLYVEEKSVRFEINPDAAARHEIGLSSKLLKLARIVREDRR